VIDDEELALPLRRLKVEAKLLPQRHEDRGRGGIVEGTGIDPGHCRRKGQVDVVAAGETRPVDDPAIDRIIGPCRTAFEGMPSAFALTV
jgi:hypothetical protein